MLNNPILSPTVILPRDLLILLFSYFNLRDLFNVGLVSRLWQRIFNDSVVWRYLVDQHFPYLSQKNGTQYQEDPKRLFLKELKLIDDYISREVYFADISIVKSYLLTALRGEVEKIEQSPISIDAKMALYQFSAANGYQAVLDKLNTNISIKALIIASKNSHMPAIKMLTKAGSWLWANAFSKLIEAAANGHVDALQDLYRQTDSPLLEDNKRDALKVAAEYGQLAVVQALLTQAGAVILDEHKEDALYISATFGQVNVVQALLPSPGVSLGNKIKALCLAARYGQLEVFKALLAQVGEELSSKDMVSFFYIASEYRQLKVVQFCLMHEGSVIPTKSKIEALVRANKHGHHDVAQILSQDLASWDQTPLRSSQISPIEAAFIAGGYASCGQDLGEVLLCSALSGSFNLVQTLLTRHGKEISTNSKIEALVKANHFNYPEIVQVLSRDLAPRVKVEPPPQPPAPALQLPLVPQPMTVAYSAKRKDNSETTQQLVEDEESPINKRAKLG